MHLELVDVVGRVIAGSDKTCNSPMNQRLTRLHRGPAGRCAGLKTGAPPARLRTGSGARTRTSREGQEILSLPRLPISPSRQARPAANSDHRKTRKHTPNAPPRRIRSG